MRTADELPALLEQASKHERSYSDFLDEVISHELAARHDRHAAMKTSMALPHSLRHRGGTDRQPHPRAQ